MIKTRESLPDRVKKLISNKDKLSIKTSKINSQLEKYLLLLITEILKKYNKEKFTEMLYTIVKELAINAIKANQKRVFFEDHNLDILKENDYREGIILFKQSFSDNMSETYGQKCLENGIYVQIVFHFEDSGMYVEVTNNTPVIKAEEVRMRENMKKAMTYNDIAEFYMDNMDNTEGAGLGIALIMILMKNENLDPNLFRIITKPTETIARIEVPFTTDYVSLRNKGA